MFKRGFTLAEILITLSIIGFVSALTIPGLVQHAADAEIEPKLNKAQTAIAQASKTLLYDQGIDRVSDLSLFGSDGSSELNGIAYMNLLCEYLRCTGSYTNGAGFVYQILSDGTALAFSSPLYKYQISSQTKPHKFRIGVYHIDVNGKSSPNIIGKDIFTYNAYDDGSLRK